MHAYILIGGNIESRAKYIEEISTGLVEIIHLIAEKSSLTIKQVQELNDPLSVSPRIPRIVWIEEANQLTIPAQNALLKMLEEPPENTDFYLTCQSSAMLLPTIRSRAKILKIADQQSSSDPKVLADLKLIMALSPGDRLASVVKRDRSETILWLTQIELSLKERLHDQSLANHNYLTLAKIAKNAQIAHAQLLANCSVGLTTQNFYLLLPHTHSTA